ncbi:MAG: FAD-dependent monooxygenase, partial [Thermoanaerobaculia bacterium]|nr:FAD-dependent monooxygenase [Thermoanaerobaculia bacterium]
MTRPRVAVVGGGPAGATAARLLAGWGHGVVLVTRRADPSAAIAESLPPSCRRLFRHLGIEGAVDAAGFLPSTGNTVWWGSPQARVEWFPHGETGWQVWSTSLEELLLALAAKAG